MDQNTAIAAFACLSSGHRLAIFRLLVKHAPDGLVAGEIATALAIAPTNLSFHLKALTHAGLLDLVPQGRYQRFRANLALMQELIGYLTDECCLGQRGRCDELPARADCRPAAAPARSRATKKPRP